jgi:hypothetical protein
MSLEDREEGFEWLFVSLNFVSNFRGGPTDTAPIGTYGKLIAKPDWRRTTPNISPQEQT